MKNKKLKAEKIRNSSIFHFSFSKFSFQFLPISVLLLFSFFPISFLNAAFPEKPVKIIVYTGPGGLIDITARKFADIASKYTDANFVVENKPGAGGIIALQRVLQMKPDGYTLYACTKSNIAKFISTGGDAYLDALNWLAMLMADPECLITYRQSDIKNWDDIINDAEVKDGGQKWVGPAVGGLDHVTALKIWDKSGISAKWIPYKSGGKAKAALLGKHGVVYVGNPREVLGNSDLKIAAVSQTKRLDQFPDAPTFTELGLSGLENEYMWRGFAIKKDVPEDILSWYQKLFQQVNDDPEWREFWERGGIDVQYLGTDQFTKIVEQDAEEFRYYLEKINLIQFDDKNAAAKFGLGTEFINITASLILITAVVLVFFKYSRRRFLLGHFLIILFFLGISVIFYFLSFTFPETSTIGSATVPRLWIYLLIPLNTLLLIKTMINKDIEIKKGRTIIVYYFIMALIVYLFAIFYLGYFISTFVFLAVSMILLGYKKYKVIFIISTSWIIFSYLIFYKLLYIPLPVGQLIEMVF